jgi:hypothetical protein
VQRIFNLKFKIPTKMPRRVLTLADKTALLEQIKIQPPNTTHGQLAEITGVPKSTVASICSSKRNCEMNGHYAKDNRKFPQNGSVKVRIQMLKRPSINDSLF